MMFVWYCNQALIAGKKEDLRKRVDDIKRKINCLTSDLLYGDARRHFFDMYVTR